MAKRTTAPKQRTTRRQTSTELPQEYQDALQKARTMEVGGRYWKPEKNGDGIVGRVLAIEEKRGKFGKYPELSLELADGSSRIVSCQTVLASLVTSLAITPGEAIAIAYRGKSKKGKKGKPANLFTLARVEA